MLSENGRVAHGDQSLNERGDVIGWTAANEWSSARGFLWRAGRTTGTDSTNRPVIWTPLPTAHDGWALR
ncbi:hypothetical protein [Saccharothrix luteola]|uniref:hypothetical protein n=1 Tax=Saccharothrix luteola TaxID=2893018 RepID=UPI001E3C2CD6|nr:hypothetical protein [Saccharothrix luteola]MCC8246789.1 hypothetical protein [Saccharothrix luteola]